MSLLAAMEDHFGAAEADFRRFYGIDLRLACWGERPFGLRRLAALVGGLPTDSALWRAMQPELAGWGTQEELLALLCEISDATNQILVRVNSKRGAPAPRPLRVPRPYDRKRRADLRRFTEERGAPVVYRRS